MATSGDGGGTFQSGGAGGKFRKRRAPATPYDRPSTALSNNNPSLFSKVVDPASRLIYASADRLFGVFRKRLPSTAAQLQSGTIEEPKNLSQEAVEEPASTNSTVVVKPQVNAGGSSASMPVATEISDLENLLKQKSFTRSELERLTALLQSKTESNVDGGDNSKLPSSSNYVSTPFSSTSGTLTKSVEEREPGNFDAAISTPVINSRAFEDNCASPADLAKAYMGTRPAKLSPLALRPNSHAPRQNSVLANNTITFPKTPMTSLTPKASPSPAAKTFENDLTAFRSRGRSALYNMPRTPYYRGPSTLSRKGVASPFALESEGLIASSRMGSKRRSSALDDMESGGPMRKIRQKASLLSLYGERSSSQKLLLRNEPEKEPLKAVEENGEISKQNRSYGPVPTESSRMALKIFEQLEKMSPKEKPSGSKLTGATENTDSLKLLSSSQDNKKSEGQQRVLFSDASESTSRSQYAFEENGSRNIKPVSGIKSIVTKTGSATKQAFSMSVREDALQVDDDNHSTGAPAGQTALSKVDPISGVSEFKKGAISSGAQKRVLFSDAIESTSRSKYTFEENGSSSFQPFGASTYKNFSSGSSNALSSSTSVFLPSSTAVTTTTAASSAFSTSAPAPIFASGMTNASSASASMAPASSASALMASTSLFASTSNNGGSIFGLNSSSATANGLSGNTQAASTAVKLEAPFKFSSASTSVSSFFNPSSPSFGLTPAAASSSGGSTTFSSTTSVKLGSTVASPETKPGSLTTNIFGSGLSSAPSFGLVSSLAASETKSGSSTSNIFSSTTFSFGESTSPPPATSSPFIFGSSNAGASTALTASTGFSIFSFSSNSSSPAIAGSSTPNNNNHTQPEDSITGASTQTPSTAPSFPSFAASASTPVFKFGSSPSTPPSNIPFQFGGQTNQPSPQPQPPLQNPFQASGDSWLNAGSGGFSLGSGGDDNKSSRRTTKRRR